MERGFAIRDRWLCDSHKTKRMSEYNLLSKTQIVFTVGEQSYDLDELKEKIATYFQQTERRLNMEVAALLTTNRAHLLVDNLRTLGLSKGYSLYRTLLSRYGGSLLCEEMLLPDKIETVQEILQTHKDALLKVNEGKIAL